MIDDLSTHHMNTSAQADDSIYRSRNVQAWLATNVIDGVAKRTREWEINRFRLLVMATNGDHGGNKIGPVLAENRKALIVCSNRAKLIFISGLSAVTQCGAVTVIAVLSSFGWTETKSTLAEIKVNQHVFTVGNREYWVEIVQGWTPLNSVASNSKVRTFPGQSQYVSGFNYAAWLA